MYASGTHSTHPVHTGLIWYAFGMHPVRTVRVWYAFGTHLVRIWCASGTHLVRMVCVSCCSDPVVLLCNPASALSHRRFMVCRFRSSPAGSFKFKRLRAIVCCLLL